MGTPPAASLTVRRGWLRGSEVWRAIQECPIRSPKLLVTLEVTSLAAFLDFFSPHPPILLTMTEYWWPERESAGF